MTQQPDSRPCTCAPDERPYPCQHKYALGECRKAEIRALRVELDRAIAQMADLTKQRLADEYAHGNVMGRIAIALWGDQNNRTDEECVAAVAELSYERSGAIQRAKRAEAERNTLRALLREAREDWIKVGYGASHEDVAACRDFCSRIDAALAQGEKPC